MPILTLKDTLNGQPHNIELQENKKCTSILLEKKKAF